MLSHSHDSTVGDTSVALHTAVAPVANLPKGLTAGSSCACTLPGQLRACTPFKMSTGMQLRSVKNHEVLSVQACGV